LGPVPAFPAPHTDRGPASGQVEFVRIIHGITAIMIPAAQAGGSPITAHHLCLELALEAIGKSFAHTLMGFPTPRVVS